MCIGIANLHDKEMMPEHEESISTRKKRSKIVTGLAWLIVVVLVPMCGAWIIGRRVYWFDILTSQQMLISWVAFGFGVLVIIARRKRIGLFCIVLACLSVYPVLTGRNWMLDAVDLTSKPVGVLRVVSSNFFAQNEHWEHDLETLMLLDADIIVLMEAPPDINRGIQFRGMLDGSGWNWVARDPVAGYLSPSFILSPHLIERVSIPSVPNSHRDILLAKVTLPESTVLIAQGHPHSPRTNERWKMGNDFWDRTIFAITHEHARQDLPVILGADLNSAPAGVRSQRTRKAGLKTGKPIFGEWGSYPSAWPALLRTHIDDVWTSDGARVIAWSSIELQGSDHRCIITDIELKSQD